MVAYVTGRVVPRMKCMEYDRVDLIFLVRKRVFIGYIDGEGIFMWSIRNKTCFPERYLSYSSMIVISRVDLRN